MSEPRMLSADEVREIQERKRPPCFENGGYPSVRALCEYADLTRTDIPNLCYTVERLREEIHEWEESDKAGRVFTDIIDEQQSTISRLKQERDEAFQVICTAYEQNARCLNGSAENTLKSYIQKVKYQSTPVAEPQEERAWCSICGSWLDLVRPGKYQCNKCEEVLSTYEPQEGR